MSSNTNFQQQRNMEPQTQSNIMRRGLNDLFFSPSNTDYINSVYPSKNDNNNNNTTNIPEYNVFSHEMMMTNKPIEKKSQQMQVASNFSQLAQIIENAPVDSYDFVDTPQYYQQQQQQPPQTATKREVSMFYLTEISQFTNEEVASALHTRVDNTTGELYGPIQEFKVGSYFNSRQEFIPKLHRESLRNVCYPSTGGAASSVLIRDQDDRGNLILFTGESVNVEGMSMNELPLLGSNAALAQNVRYKIPIRVIRSLDNGLAHRYDGMYFVSEYWFERMPENNSKWQYIFKFVRIYGQPALPSSNTSSNNVHVEPVRQQTVNSYAPSSMPVYQPQQMPVRQFNNHNNNNNSNNYNQQKQSYSGQQNNSHTRAEPKAMKPPLYQPSYIPMSRSIHTSSAPENAAIDMDLNHLRIREMLSKLRGENNTFNNRITQYEHNIENISGKKEIELIGLNKEDVTSRNKGFYWNLGAKENEQYDSSSFNNNNNNNKAPTSQKRRRDDSENDAGDEGCSRMDGSSPSSSNKEKKTKKRVRHNNVGQDQNNVDAGASMRTL